MANFNPNPFIPKDWREELIRLLLDAGTDGMKKKDIVKTLQNLVGADEIENELQTWLAEDKVQKFTVPARRDKLGRPAIWWRATTRLLEEC